MACDVTAADDIAPVVEVEEDIDSDTNAQNGAGPMWCTGSTTLVRTGDRLFASGLKTIPEAKPLNNCRWMLGSTGDSQGGCFRGLAVRRRRNVAIAIRSISRSSLGACPAPWVSTAATGQGSNISTSVGTRGNVLAKWSTTPATRPTVTPIQILHVHSPAVVFPDPPNGGNEADDRAGHGAACGEEEPQTGGPKESLGPWRPKPVASA